MLASVLPAAAVLVVLLGFLPLSGLAELWERVWHILLFVTAMTVVTELLFAAGVFERLTTWISRWGRGSVRLLCQPACFRSASRRPVPPVRNLDTGGGNSGPRCPSFWRVSRLLAESLSARRDTIDL